MASLPGKPAHLFLALGGALILAGGVAFVAGVFKPTPAEAAAEAAPQGPPPANVQVASATVMKLAPHSQAPGSIVSVNDSLIAAATGGPVVWVADVGSIVAEGDVIARIDPVDATLLRDESRADISRLSSRADYLARLVERFEGLGEDGGESEASLDQMRADRDEAAQNLARARVALRRAETALERTQVRAPFAGRIAQRQIEIGEYAQPGSPIVRLVNLEALEVTARAPDTLLANVHAGDSIAVANGAETLNAEVRAIVPVGDTVSRTLELRLVLPSTDWHIGSAVQVSLPRSTPKPVVTVHRDALILRAERVSVFKIDAENTARRVDVELGAADGDLIEVIGDIKAGDRVVVRGGERLRDGQPVAVQDTAGGALS